MTDPAKLTDAIEAIEAHLAGHPLAADSAEGVARWWVAAHGVTASSGDVEQALARLVRQRRLRKVQLVDGNTLYCGSAAAAEAPPMWRM